MLTRDDLIPFVVDALTANGGCAKVVEVCKYIWNRHERQLQASGDLFYTWQYDVRWAATKLRKRGVLKRNDPGEPWCLAK